MLFQPLSPKPELPAISAGAAETGIDRITRAKGRCHEQIGQPQVLCRGVEAVIVFDDERVIEAEGDFDQGFHDLLRPAFDMDCEISQSLAGRIYHYKLGCGKRQQQFLYICRGYDEGRAAKAGKTKGGVRSTPPFSMREAGNHVVRVCRLSPEILPSRRQIFLVCPVISPSCTDRGWPLGQPSPGMSSFPSS